MLDRKSFCDTEFWNANLTWYTDKPQLSPCFRDTILVWVPAIFIWSTSFVQLLVVSLRSSKKHVEIPWNTINVSRITFSITLCSLNLLECLNYIYVALLDSEENDLVLSTFIVPFIQLSCFSLLTAIYYYHRITGIHTSGLVWSYLFVSLLCGLPDFYLSISNIRATTTSISIEYVAKFASYPLLCALFGLDCIGDCSSAETFHSLDGRPICPEITSSFFSQLTFGWFNTFLMDGFRRPITLASLWQTPTKEQAQFLAPQFDKRWTSAEHGKKKFLSADGHENYHNHVAAVILKMFKWDFASAAGLKLFQDILAYTTPIILKQMLRYMNSDNDEPQWHGILFAICLLIIPTSQTILTANYLRKMQVIGLQLRSMLIGAIYKKSMFLSSSSRQESTTGEIVNLMAVDSQRIMDMMMHINLIWSAPIQIMITIFMLYQELGWAVFGGLTLMILLMPCNSYLASKIKQAQSKIMKIKDERIKQMSEILCGIKVLKLYAWEHSFIKNIAQHRIKELKYSKLILMFEAFGSFCWSCSPFLVAVASFAVYVVIDTDNVLDAEKIFVSLALFNLLRYPLNMLPDTISQIMTTLVSVNRLSIFFNKDELELYVTNNDELEAVSIEDASMSWKLSGEVDVTSEPLLKNINLHVSRGSFVALVGQVASGKSSLLASILGEMHRIKGRFNVSRSLTIAYVPQQAWIQNMTVRDNILFGKEYDEKKYEQVMSACSLYADLASLPGGDQSEIGEKGINLSGGQKQRVSLARACYSDADIYLLDDPLSAVDSHVAKHLYENVLSSTTGLLKDRTRILATNNLFVLPYTDQIEVLKEGRIIESGTYKKLIDTEGGYFSEFMRQYSKTSDVTTEKDDGKPSTVAEILTVVSNDIQPVESNEGAKEMPQAIENTETADRKAGKLIGIEESETGSVKFSVYLQYFKAVSFFWLIVVAVFIALSSVFNVATNFWLSLWSSDSTDPTRATDVNLRTKRMLIYALLGGAEYLTILVSSLALAVGAIQAATSLHYRLLDRVLHSPMRFFDTTPMGRIVNRFAKDIDVLDSTLPENLESWLFCLADIFCSLFIICFSFPIFIAIFSPLALVYYLIQKVFIVTTRQIKRLESVNRSPMYSHFSETLTGISVIRAYDCNSRFIDQNNKLVDINRASCYPNIIANRWLSIRLEFFGSLTSAAAAFFSVYYRDSVGAGIAGLTITNALNITPILNWLVRMTTSLETNIVSVERIIEYINNKIEDAWYKDKRPADDWPQNGAIEFRNYSTQYREDTDIVLKNLNLSILPKEKVGIVGRTGSGKSSLSLAIFRLLESAGDGKILIDGLDTSQIGLHDLRSKLTIIPQDPVLFSGTIRYNLDPLGLYNDEQIWHSLKMAHLKSYIVATPGRLDSKVSEFGENFSVGQRQLICLARAILRKSQILVLDEATAAVDLETDSLVFETIRKEFNDCTVITIAHRLHTILDSDKILVLDSGQIKEFDTPKALLANRGSIFAKMVEAANIKID